MRLIDGWPDEGTPYAETPEEIMAWPKLLGLDYGHSPGRTLSDPEIVAFFYQGHAYGVRHGELGDMEAQRSILRGLACAAHAVASVRFKDRVADRTRFVLAALADEMMQSTGDLRRHWHGTWESKDMAEDLSAGLALKTIGFA